jgi:DNA segregation ATPase FtsK/SpoIIIE, S-DNA-T family
VSDKAVDLRIHLGLDEPPLIGSQAGYISIDVQLPTRRTVTLQQALADVPPDCGNAPVFPAGLDVAGQTHWINLGDTADCHLLVAGTTGSGKSEFLKALVAGLAARMPQDQIQFYLIDPKRVTFNLGGQKSPYLRAPIAYDTEEALPLVEECLAETKRRYGILEEQKVSNVAQLVTELIPQIVLVIDEFANLMEEQQTKKVMTALLRQIGSMSRAAGIHLVLATQRPDKDVVTPLLRDNLPGRIALKVASPANSNLILGGPDAAHLLGKGDLLWKRGGGMVRLQSPFVTQQEFEKHLGIA